MAKEISRHEVGFGRSTKVPRILNCGTLPVAGTTGVTADTDAALADDVGRVGLFFCPAYMKVEKIAYFVGVAGNADSSVRLALYDEEGVLLGQGTQACVDDTGRLVCTLDTPVLLSPGNYYIFICMAAGTAGPQVAHWIDDGDSGDVFNVSSAAPEVICNGTVVCVSGAAPSPLGTVTGQDGECLAAKLIGQA